MTNSKNSSVISVADKNSQSNLVSVSSTKTQRVLESRDDWSVVFDHTVSLIVSTLKGGSLDKTSRKGYAFKANKRDDDGKAIITQPHIKPYAVGLLAGFASKKASKFLKETSLADVDRTEIALAILKATKLSGETTEQAQKTLSKAEPKQVRRLCIEVLNSYGVKHNLEIPQATAKAVEAQAEVSEAKADEPKVTAKAVKATTKGGKASAKKTTTKGGKRQTRKNAAA